MDTPSVSIFPLISTIWVRFRFLFFPVRQSLFQGIAAAVRLPGQRFKFRISAGQSVLEVFDLRMHASYSLFVLMVLRRSWLLSSWFCVGNFVFGRLFSETRSASRF